MPFIKLFFPRYIIFVYFLKFRTIPQFSALGFGFCFVLGFFFPFWNTSDCFIICVSIIKQNVENSRGEGKPIVFPHTFAYYVHLFLVYEDSLFYHILSV